MPIFLFFDIDKQHVRAHQKLLENQIPNSQFILEDVRKIKADVFVSPANSYGYMDGGIDEIYSEMFPGIQKTVQDKIKAVSTINTRYGKPFLPVGCGLTVDTGTGKKLISVPTMDVPRDIRKTPENVYYAMIGILKLSDHYKNDTVVAIPGLGTGVGALSPEECSEQILLAYRDYHNMSIKHPRGTQIEEGDDFYLAKFP